MVGLGDLPGGAVLGDALAVSADGSVIVGSGETAAGAEAFVWTSDSGMQRLWDVLVSNGVNPATSGWTRLLDATAISYDGNTIVGSGLRGGNTEAFIAVIPEPASAALLLTLATPALLARRPRQ
jgi:uncharacterized membrane protein